MDQELSTAGSEPSLPNFPTRFMQVFTSPAALFDALRERPVWLDAMLATIAISLLVQFMIPDEILRESMMANLPSDASPQQIEATGKMADLIGSFGWVLVIGSTLFLFAFLAGVLKLVYGVLLGGAVTFKQMFSATAHAQLINAVGSLLTLPLVRATGDLRSTLSFHLLAPGLERDGWLFGFLQGLSLFGLWTMVVLGIAVSRISPKISATSAIAFLVGVYVLLKAVLAVVGPGPG